MGCCKPITERYDRYHGPQWKFLVTQVLLVTLDIGSDINTAVEHYYNGHPMWGLSTLGLVFVPFLLSIVTHHLIQYIKTFKLKTLWTQLRTIGHWFSPRAIAKSLKNIPSWLKKSLTNIPSRLKTSLTNIPSWLKKSLTTVPEMKYLDKLPECFLHLFFLQPLNQVRFLIQLHNATLILDAAKKDFRDAEKPNDKMSYKAKENYARLEKKESEAKKQVARVQGKFLQTKIFEAYGESAPQFCLQLAIVLQVGYIQPHQIATVITSFLSVSLAASNVYSKMPSKYFEIPHQDWKNLLYIFPAMFFSICPRLLCLSLFIAYARAWTLIAIVLAFLVELALLRKYLKNDQGNSLMGMFTSWFAPCIVKDHYSKFFLRTSLFTTATYIVAISLLFALVKMELIVPAIQSFPPIIHCFKVTEWIPTTNQTRCSYNGTIMQDCLSTLVTVNEFRGFVPVCQAGEQVWHRLGWVCLVLVIFLLISLASGYFLHWYLDPINRLKATSCRCWCLGQVWDPEQEDIKDAVVKIVVNHQFLEFETLNADFMHKKKTLLYCAVEEGLIQFVEVLDQNCNAYLLDSAENNYSYYKYLIINRNPLVAAVAQDRPKVLNLLIDIIKCKGNSNSDEEVGLLSHKATIWEPFFKSSKDFYETGMDKIKSIEVFKLIHDEYDKSEDLHGNATEHQRVLRNFEISAAKIGYLAFFKDRHKTTDWNMADEHNFDTTVFHVAANNGQVELVKFFLELEGDKSPADRDGNTPLHCAAQGGHLEVVTAIWEKVTEKNPADNDGRTPLHWAAQIGDLEVVKAILEKVSDNPADNDGTTPLHYAAHGGHLEVVKAILEKVSDNPADNDGKTPLHLAAEEGHLAMVKAIWEKVTEKCPADKRDRTPLHLAAEYGKLQVVQYMLPLLDDKSPKDMDGQTPLDVAEKRAKEKKWYSKDCQKVVDFIKENLPTRTAAMTARAAREAREAFFAF